MPNVNTEILVCQIIGPAPSESTPMKAHDRPPLFACLKLYPSIVKPFWGENCGWRCKIKVKLSK